MDYVEHMIVNQSNDGQEGKATTAFYTHTKCRWNQYPPPPPATASKKCFPTAFARFTSTPISIHRNIGTIIAKKCPPIEIISQHDTFANHFLHVLYFLRKEVLNDTTRHASWHVCGAVTNSSQSRIFNVPHDI